jgi:hypothetical protein
MGSLKPLTGGRSEFEIAAAIRREVLDWPSEANPLVKRRLAWDVSVAIYDAWRRPP